VLLFIQIIDFMRVGIRSRCAKPAHLTVLPTAQSEAARCDREKTIKNCDCSDGLFSEALKAINPYQGSSR
jgi:hypothetical protein